MLEMCHGHYAGFMCSSPKIPRLSTPADIGNLDARRLIVHASHHGSHLCTSRGAYLGASHCSSPRPQSGRDLPLRPTVQTRWNGRAHMSIKPSHPSPGLCQFHHRHMSSTAIPVQGHWPCFPHSISPEEHPYPSNPSLHTDAHFQPCFSELDRGCKSPLVPSGKWRVQEERP